MSNVNHGDISQTDNNITRGWFALRSDGGIRSVKLSAFRTELEHSAREKGYEPGEEMIDFTTLLVTLGLYTVGQNALPQDVKLKRKAELELLYQDAIARKLQAIIRGNQVRKVEGKEARARRPLGVIATLLHEPTKVEISSKFASGRC
uniref:Uncharacterized protein n=1 Tax=Cryptomonas curvata TaxID=233186 RepID=A0A7S0MUT2_9CRYP|mmetsp:Transcript_54844/g.114768  ORF Transcript_54844/g.114768 Transcript_54844/m.114768 type:complete len:148 (+) Transcript_54844:130-573(+)